MTESPESTTAADAAPPAGDAAAKAPRKRSGGLNSMLLADLKAMAGGMGIRGAGSMKKAALVEAIKAAQTGASGQSTAATAAPEQGRQQDRQQGRAPEQKSGPKVAEKSEPKAEQKAEQRSGDKPEDNAGEARQHKDRSADKQGAQGSGRQASQQGGQQGKQDNPQAKQDNPQGKQDTQQGKQQGKQGNQQQGKQDQKSDQPQQKQAPKQGNQQGNQQQGKQDGQQAAKQAQQEPSRQDASRDDDADDDGEGGSRRNRRRRGRDRERPGRAAREPDTEVREDDVLVPGAGILDVLDNYAFVRTSGYLPGTDDVYLSLSMVRKYGLRRGDAIVGQVRQPREGERREKFNPMVRIDSVNGVDPEHAKNRVEFDTLVPISPADRLRLETGTEGITGRAIDLVTPLGKGQRGLVLAPSDAGKTATLQAIANAVTTNNPECHLMVVLIDERPEEVTDFQRAVKGEVAASTFDRVASDHTTLAELAIERAKRLVELGHDVVVLLDGLDKLGRAYNLTAPASGRILPGGVDAAALHAPKKLFGAARNIENGGSLTMLATALVDSGSKLDEAILEEFNGTSNLVLRLSGKLADRGLFPAIDIAASRTRKLDQLLGAEEVQILGRLRSELTAADPQAALEQLLGLVRNSQTNYEALVRFQRS